jgi:hypothetical protein
LNSQMAQMWKVHACSGARLYSQNVVPFGGKFRNECY